MSTKISRRDLLLNSVYGLGGAAMVSAFLPGGGLLAAPVENSSFVDPLAAKAPHFPARAKSVIWLHQDGAPSSLDLYDYKPGLVKLAGQEVPPSYLTGIKTSTQGGVGKLFASKRTWRDTEPPPVGPRNSWCRRSMFGNHGRLAITP